MCRCGSSTWRWRCDTASSTTHATSGTERVGWVAAVLPSRRVNARPVAVHAMELAPFAAPAAMTAHNPQLIPHTSTCNRL